MVGLLISKTWVIYFENIYVPEVYTLNFYVQERNSRLLLREVYTLVLNIYVQEVYTLGLNNTCKTSACWFVLDNCIVSHSAVYVSKNTNLPWGSCQCILQTAWEEQLNILIHSTGSGTAHVLRGSYAGVFYAWYVPIQEYF